MNNWVKFILAFFLLANISFAQFTSVKSGKWHWASTWSTDPNASAIPDSNDNVVVFHDVDLDGGGRCLNLTVEYGGRVHNGSLGVYGSVQNNGTINGLGEWSSMSIDLRGNLTNTGRFESQVNFMGSIDQIVESSDTLKLAYGFDRSPGSNIIFEEEIILKESFLFLNGANLQVTSDLTLVESGVDGGIIVGNNNTIFGVYGEIGWGHAVGFGPQKTTLTNVTLEGTLGFYGYGEDGIWATILGDNVVNNGTIYNQYLNGGGRTSIYANSDFINNGTIKEQQDGFQINVRSQNFVNNGTYESGTLSLIGDQHQIVSLSDVTIFTPTQVELHSDVEGNSYQWEKDGSAITNATSATYILYGFQESDQGIYRCLADGANYSRNITIGQSSTPQEVVLLEQHFDSDNEAAEWKIQSLNGVNSWILGNIQNANFNQIDPSSITSAICPYDANNDQDEYLISPLFSIGAGNAELEFYVGYNSTWTSNAHLEVLISLDEGQTWNSIWTYGITTNNWQWSNVNLDLTSYSNNQDVKIAFEYVGRDGDYIAIDNVKVTGYEYVTDIKNSEDILKSFSLSQNYPNPFNPTTTIEYYIPTSGHVDFTIYDSIGREVVKLVNSVQDAGSHKIDFDASNLASGIYFYRIKSRGYLSTKKMLLIK